MQNAELALDTGEMNMKNEGLNKGLEWTNLILGLCLVFAAFMFAAIPAAAWNVGIVGTLIACSSAIALYRYGDWAEWSDLTLGSWVVVAPFLLGFESAPAAMWTHILIGLCIASIAVAQLLAKRSMGLEQELLPNTRRHYQPNAATFERRSIPPAFVRRTSRPTAERNKAGSCKAGGILAHKVLVS
jgi:hypothetical protein